MIEKCAEKIADWLVSCGAVEKADKELYSYAVYSTLMSISPLLLAIGFGLCMGCVRQSVMIILPFVVIRKFSGGYHARYAWFCLLCSCLLLFFCIVFSFHIKCGWILALFTVGAAVSLICFSPIEHENKVLSREEHRQYKKVTIILVGIFLIVDLLFFLFRLSVYSVCISIGILLSAGLQLPCIFKKFVKGVERNIIND